jgi:6-phosphogluconolactonase
MRLLTRWRAGVILAAFAATAAVGAPASADQVVGHVYVNDNTAPVNTIAAFDRHADGTLSPVPGSPFATGGAGLGATVGSQGSLQETDNGRYLLAVDAGSNQISVLRIEWDGSLGLVRHGIVGSNGLEPVSIAVHHRLVYVANAGTTDGNYTGFLLGHHGRLWPLAGSTVSLPPGAQPGDVLFNSDGTKLAGTRVETSEIDSFRVNPGGRLTAAPGSPYTAQGLGPFGSEFRPTNPSQLFVSNAHNVGAGTGTVSAFSVAWNGGLSSIGSSPFPDSQTAPCWVEISHDGRYLFAVNTASGSISRYSIAPGGALTLLGSTPIKNPSSGGVGPFDARLSPSGDTLWVVDNGLKAVSGFRVSGGGLTELPTSPTPVPANATPFGIVVN